LGKGSEGEKKEKKVLDVEFIEVREERLSG